MGSLPEQQHARYTSLDQDLRYRHQTELRSLHIVEVSLAAALPDELARAIKPDDHYLVRAQLSAKESVLITTDRPLREVAMQAGLPCLSREEFFRAFVFKSARLT